MSTTRPETRSNSLIHRHGCDHPTPTRVPSQTSVFVIIRCPSCGATGLTSDDTPQDTELAVILTQRFPDWRRHGHGRYIVAVECTADVWQYPTRDNAQDALDDIRDGCGALECRLTHGHTIYEITGTV